jgi:hypothetical protein
MRNAIHYGDGKSLEWDRIGGTAIRTWVSLFAGLGALLVSAALSALPSMYPNEFAHHPTIVWASLIVGICLVLAGGLPRVLSRIHGPEMVTALPTAAKSVEARSEVGHIEQKEIGAHATGNQVNLYFGGPATQPQSTLLPPESVSQRNVDALGTTPDVPALDLQFCEAPGQL